MARFNALDISLFPISVPIPVHGIFKLDVVPFCFQLIVSLLVRFSTVFCALVVEFILD